jgi:hypothetical protein
MDDAASSSQSEERTDSPGKIYRWNWVRHVGSKLTEQFSRDRSAERVVVPETAPFPSPHPVSEIAVLTLADSGASAINPPRQTPIDPIADILGQAFVALCDTFSVANETRLRDIVFLFVTRLKASSLPPEQVLVATKSAISSVGNGRPPSLADSLANTGNPTRHRAYRRVFQWLLEAYFE